MRVVVAPDSFGGTLSAVDAAAAIADGWRSHAPGDEIRTVPMSDGGPGFVDVLHSGTGGRLVDTCVAGPLRGSVGARFLVTNDRVYVEAADACGLHLVDPSPVTVRSGHTTGLGELLREASVADRDLVVGIGGTATNDGGAGLVRALGYELLDSTGGRLPVDAEALRDLAEIRPAEPPRWTPPRRLLVATDVDNPLLGPNGASAVYGPQKGADRATVLDLDDALRRWADLAEPAFGRDGARNEAGAGAGGGLGFALLLLGAERVSGFALAADAVGLADQLRDADLVVTGEGSFDAQSLQGKVVSGVARSAQEHGLPCVVVAGQAHLGRREAAARGIDDIYAVADLLESAEAAQAAGADGVRLATAAAARAWSR